jgi:hypothetical protein
MSPRQRLISGHNRPKKASYSEPGDARPEGAELAMICRSRFLLSAGSIVAIAAAAAFYLTVPASAAGRPHASAKAPAAARAALAPRLAGSPVSHMSEASQVAAAERCATWATDAGFENNGYMGGSLTTIVAIGLFESGCNAAACHDNTHPNLKCSEHDEPPGDNIDRGAFQVNNVAWKQIPDSCAYSGPCAAAAAYLDVSTYNTYFAGWSSYLDDQYAFVMWPAQQAVNALRRGTVASAVTGSCLGYPQDKAGGKAKLANCATATPQIWRVVGATLRTSGGLCLAATSRTRSAVVELAKCSRSPLQEWQPGSDSALYNPGSNRCLADTVKGPGYDKPGVVLVAAPCKASQGEGWFRP